MSYFHIDTLIRRAIALGLIRIDHDLPSTLDRQYVLTLKNIGELIERLRHGLTIRRMMYDHAETCTIPLEDQLQIEESRDEPLEFNEIQQKGLNSLSKASRELPQNKQTQSINNPNIIVNCDSGTEGELGCAAGYIKVYQTVYAASYGANNYKDVFVHNEKGGQRIKIQPAPGGKTNVSIGNPYRSVGWFLNYMSQGSNRALIRMWEIPSDYFVEVLLRFCGTEKQIKDQGEKGKYFVEMCDHKAANQFGIWTHAEDQNAWAYDSDGNKYRPLVPTKAGEQFIAKSRRLVTYYDPKGKHEPNKRDGELRDIRQLLEHLGIKTNLSDRFHDFGMSLADAAGNLTMNAEAEERDKAMLRIIELIQSNDSFAARSILKLGKDELRPFANLLVYNNLSPQKFNKSTEFTKTGLVVKNLRDESRFMARVYQGNHWWAATRAVVGDMLMVIDHNATIKKEVKDSLPGWYYACTKYSEVLLKIHGAIGQKSYNTQVIDGLNVILRPLCSGGSELKLERDSRKGENFKFEFLKDMEFEIGKSHRVQLTGQEGLPDSLDGYKGGGFVYQNKFRQPLDNGIKTSNTTIQLNLHDPIVSKLYDLGIPMLGGISGTTRDIFATLRDILYHGTGQSRYWMFFNVVAAFMIKYHYHSLVECFIAAYQLGSLGGVRLQCTNADSFYQAIERYSGTDFLV